MQITNTVNQYGFIAKLLHWVMAILLISLLALGLYMTSLPISYQKLKLYGWHKEYGLLVLGLVTIRIVWRLLNVVPVLSLEDALMIKQLRGFLLVSLLSFSSVSYAALTTWEMIPEKSKLVFTGTQNNAPITGNFKKFTCLIQVDPQQLQKSNVRVVVDMSSISLSFKDFVAMLLSGEWLDVSKYPEAVFDAKHFTRLGPDRYQAKGVLIIKNKKMPVDLNFVTREMADGTMFVKGNTVIKRTAFGVGLGEWADTGVVDDDVDVEFIIMAKVKPN